MMITLRKVVKGDALALLKWKNEKDTRKNSIVTDRMIGRRAHMKWLKEALKRVEAGVCQFYVILVDGKQVGDVRLEEREISIRMDRKYRGMGLATQVIAMFSAPLTASIRAHNVASMRVFIANGFRPEFFIEGPAPYYIFKK